MDSTTPTLHPSVVKAEGKAYNAGLELHDLVKDLSNCQATRVAEAFISGMFQRERPSEKWVPGVKAICAVVMDHSSLDFIDDISWYCDFYAVVVPTRVQWFFELSGRCFLGR